MNTLTELKLGDKVECATTGRQGVVSGVYTAPEGLVIVLWRDRIASINKVETLIQCKELLWL